MNFKKILFIAGLFCLTSYTFAWYPTVNENTVRLTFGNDLNSYKSMILNTAEYKRMKVEGIISGSAYKNGFKIGSVYSMGSESSADSKLGGFVSYKINELVELSVSSDFDPTLNFTHGFCTHLYIPYKNHTFVPFIQISSNKIGSLGMISNFDLKNSHFEIGIGVHFDNDNLKNPEIRFIVGTSLDKLRFDKILGSVFKNGKKEVSK